MARFKHNKTFYLQYVEPDNSDILKSIKWLENQFKSYLSKLRVSANAKTPDAYDFDVDLVAEVFVRLDQRRLHYKMYYEKPDIMEINELKFTAILCYWIMRYHPIIKLTEPKKQCAINEYFCLFLIKATIKQYRKNNNMPLTPLNREVEKDMLYFFRNRQLSCDSVVLLVESIAKTV